LLRGWLKASNDTLVGVVEQVENGVAQKATPISILEGSCMKEFIYCLMREDSTNSRFVYLLQGIAIAIVTLGVGCAFILTKDSVARDGFSSMMVVLMGGGSVGSIARGWAKAKGTEADTAGVKANTEAIKAGTVDKIVDSKVG